MNMQEIINDKALWAEYCKAYAIAGKYRNRVQFRKDLLLSPKVYWDNTCIFAKFTEEDNFLGVINYLIDALTGYINPVLR